jgi:hypothetical protein
VHDEYDVLRPLFGADSDYNASGSLSFECNTNAKFTALSVDKGYEREVQNLQGIFPNGISFVQCDLNDSHCHFRIPNRSERTRLVEPVMDCEFAQCVFYQGSASFDCRSLACESFSSQPVVNSVVGNLQGRSTWACGEEASDLGGSSACVLSVVESVLGDVELACQSRGCDVALNGVGLGGAVERTDTSSDGDMSPIAPSLCLLCSHCFSVLQLRLACLWAAWSGKLTVLP